MKLDSMAEVQDKKMKIGQGIVGEQIWCQEIPTH